MKDFADYGCGQRGQRRQGRHDGRDEDDCAKDHGDAAAEGGILDGGVLKHEIPEHGIVGGKRLELFASPYPAQGEQHRQRDTCGDGERCQNDKAAPK